MIAAELITILDPHNAVIGKIALKTGRAAGAAYFMFDDGFGFIDGYLSPYTAKNAGQRSGSIESLWLYR